MEELVLTHEVVSHIHCISASGFIDTISPRGPYFKRIPADYDWIFRGHGNDYDYQLLSSALRLQEQERLLSLNPAGDGRGNDGRNWLPSGARLRYATGWPDRQRQAIHRRPTGAERRQPVIEHGARARAQVTGDAPDGSPPVGGDPD